MAQAEKRALIFTALGRTSESLTRVRGWHAHTLSSASLVQKGKDIKSVRKRLHSGVPLLPSTSLSLITAQSLLPPRRPSQSAGERHHGKARGEEERDNRHSQRHLSQARLNSSEELHLVVATAAAEKLARCRHARGRQPCDQTALRRLRCLFFRCRRWW